MERLISFKNCFNRKEYTTPPGCPELSEACEVVENEIVICSDNLLCDIITETADRALPFELNDLIAECTTLEFLPYIDEVSKTFGMPQQKSGVAIELYSQAEYLYYEKQLTENINTICYNACIKYLSNMSLYLNAEEKTLNEVKETILSSLQAFINNTRVESLERLASLVIELLSNHITTLFEQIKNCYKGLEIEITNIVNDENLLRALLIPVGNVPRVIYIDKNNSLKELQKLVGGYIECISLYSPTSSDIDLICNEEAKLYNFPFNRYLRNSHITGNINEVDIFDYLAGNGIILSADDEGDWISISDEDLKYWQKRFKEFETPFIGVPFLEDEKCLDFLDEEVLAEKSKTVEPER